MKSIPRVYGKKLKITLTTNQLSYITIIELNYDYSKENIHVDCLMKRNKFCGAAIQVIQFSKTMQHKFAHNSINMLTSAKTTKNNFS